MPNPNINENKPIKLFSNKIIFIISLFVQPKTINKPNSGFLNLLNELCEYIIKKTENIPIMTLGAITQLDTL